MVHDLLVAVRVGWHGLRLVHVRAGELRHFVTLHVAPEILRRVDDRVDVVIVTFEAHLDRLAFADVRVEIPPAEAGDGHVMRDLSHVVGGGGKLAIAVVPVGAPTVRVRGLDLQHAERIRFGVVEETVQRGVHQRMLLGHEADVGDVDDLVLRVQLAESAAQFDLQGVALDDRPLAADVLRLLTARLLQPQLVRGRVLVEAEDRAHVRAADAQCAELAPRTLTIRLRALAETVHVEQSGRLRCHVNGHSFHCCSLASIC